MNPLRSIETTVAIPTHFIVKPKQGWRGKNQTGFNRLNCQARVQVPSLELTQ